MDSTEANPSIYDHLDATTSQVRVLRLHQGSLNQELRCSLKTVSLDDQPQFHALSYVWGSGTDKDRLNVHGHVVPITSSLATVLRRFRSHHYDFLQLHSTPLWIDAICINQADVDERSQQVLLMRRIYCQASRVLLWIGDGDEHSDHAFDRMNDSKFRASCGELKAISREPTLDQVRVKTIMKRNLEERRYWTRIWILQEFVLATQDPIMLCGSGRILWSSYTQCSADLPENQWSYPSLTFDWATIEREVPWHQDHYDVPHVSLSFIHEAIRDHYGQLGPIPFDFALTMASRLDATDLRDHVYGLLGLVSTHELNLVDIDYRKTPERVFRDAMAVVWTSGADDLISDVIPHFIFGLADTKLDLPSWVPDLSKQASTSSYNATGLKAGTRPWRPERKAEIRVEGNILTVKAYKFDRITDTMKLDSSPGHGWPITCHREKEPMEVNFKPIQDIEGMTERGREIPIPTSSRLAPFLVLRDKTSIWSALTAWNEDSRQHIEENRRKDDEWLPEVPKDSQKVWEILLGRREIPEDWKMASSPELRHNLPALEAAILKPIMQSIRTRFHGRKVFISSSGFVGVGTTPVESGDIIILIAGMMCMYVLRPFQDGYRMVGFAKVSGLMNWEDLDEAMKAGTLHEEELKIY